MQPSTSAPGPSSAQLAHCCSNARVDFDFRDPCYVFKAVLSPDSATIAASLSNNAIKTFACSHPAALVAAGDLPSAHTGTITDVGFPLPDCPHALYSSSRDGTVKGWDLRTKQQADL